MVQRVNAALRSSKASTETSLSSEFQRRPSTTLSRSVFLYADCLNSSRSFSDRFFCLWVKKEKNKRRILEKRGRYNTGRKRFRSLGSSPGFFNIGVTIACLIFCLSQHALRGLHTVWRSGGQRSVAVQHLMKAGVINVEKPRVGTLVACCLREVLDVSLEVNRFSAIRLHDVSNRFRAVGRPTFTIQ